MPFVEMAERMVFTSNVMMETSKTMMDAIHNVWWKVDGSALMDHRFRRVYAQRETLQDPLLK